MVSLFVLLLPLLAIASSQPDEAREPDNAVGLRGATDDDDDARRELLKLKCTTDPNLSEDSIWYTIEVDIFSITDLQCNAYEWQYIRRALENELDKMDLYDQFKIIDLNPKLCDNPARRQLLGSADEDDPNDSQGVIKPSSVVGQRRLAEPMIIWYDLFYRGGSSCLFCIPDNGDANSRLLLQGSLSNRTIATAAAQNTMNSNNDPIGDAHDVYDDIGFENAEVFFNEDVDDETYHQDYTDMDDYGDTPTVMSNLTATTITATDDDDDDDDDAQTARALIRCGGCYRLNGNSEGSTKVVDKKTYVNKNSYWGAPYAVRVSAVPKNNMCKSPGGMVNLFDAGNPGKSPHLGMPNQGCPEKGPGVGAGGKQKWSNGSLNPHRNCYAGTNSKVWTLQRPNNAQTEACNHGFSIHYNFRFPVSINVINFLDVHEENSVKVTIELTNGKKQHFWAKNTGRNSLQFMGFKGIKGVKKIKIDFKKGGGKFSAPLHLRVSLLVVVRFRFVSKEVKQSSDLCSGQSLSLCVCSCLRAFLSV